MPLAEAAGPLQPGQFLGGGDYRIVRPLGKGGMGATWLVAQSKAFDRLAVLKEIIDYFDPADAAARQDAVERFEAEARTLAELKHPGIPDLYAYFSEGGHNFLVEEYVEGSDLSRGLTREDGDTGQLIPGGPLPADQVLRYTIEVCEVLEYLASQQPPIVHNDIKPSNILVDSHSGRAVVVDFGTALVHHPRTPGTPSQKKETLYGTVGYAAPELYEGHSEPRSDVYSLAATAYQLLTDDDPRDHPAQYPQLDSLPAPLADMLRAALAPQVDKRLTATQFREQLESYLAGQTAPLRALSFPNGAVAGDRGQLLALAVKHWHYAAALLQDGTLSRWLQQTLRDPPAAQAAEAAARQWPGNADAALDAFIRQVDPKAMPPGKMELHTTSFRLSTAPGQRPIPQQIEIANRGLGYLRGEILSSQPWVTVGSGRFGCPPGEICSIAIQIDPGGLVPGQPPVAAVTLSPAGGAPEVVPVQVVVAAGEAVPVGKGPAASAITVSPDRVDFGAVFRQALNTSRERVTVRNTGQAPARCRVQGAPGWLIVNPETFRLMPGAEQTIELVGRVQKIQGRHQDSLLTIEAVGGQSQELRVSVRIKGSGIFG